ncbi:MAG: hypothetical protein IT427_14935 [Pirellulales bacterium]|nr:hypothetical protein [Pirellulales bacterium]
MARSKRSAEQESFWRFAQTRRLLDSEERIREGYWKSLSENERQEIEREAFEQADSLALAGWKQANMEDGRSHEDCRRISRRNLEQIP